MQPTSPQPSSSLARFDGQITAAGATNPAWVTGVCGARITRSQTIAVTPSAPQAVSEEAASLRERDAQISHPPETRASRKRKREDDPPSPRAAGGESDGESVPDDAKSTGPTLAKRARTREESSYLSRPEIQSEPLPPHPEPPLLAQAGSHAQDPVTAAPAVAVTVAAPLAAPTHEEAELEEETYEEVPPQHGEYVSVYAGDSAEIAQGTWPAPAESTSGRLLYEEAVFTQHNETIAICTEADRGVFTQGIEDEVVFIYSSPRGVGLMVIAPDEMINIGDDLAQARMDFASRTGSQAGIRIRMGHNPAWQLGNLMQSLPDSSLDAVRAELQLPPGTTDSRVRDAFGRTILAARTRLLETIARACGVVDPLVSLPHGAIHVMRDAIDLFEAPPDYALPDNINRLPGEVED